MNLILWWNNFCLSLLCGISANRLEYLNEWLLEIPGGKEAAKLVAKDYNYRLIKELSEFSNVFYFLHDKVPRRSKRAAVMHVQALEADRRVIWAEQQTAKIRMKRDLISFASDESTPDHPTALSFPSIPNLTSNQQPMSEIQIEERNFFNDPLWEIQWYLLDSPLVTARTMRAINSPISVSLNVIPSWRAGYSGKDIVVTILDDGLETSHSDLSKNYDPEASCNINDNNRDPTPRYDNPEDTHHGTRCAGEVAMQANNNVCGVGIAFNARIGAVKMLDGTVTDRVEAEAFSFNNNYIDIYSSSWGPSDNGKTVEKPGLMAAKALERGVTEGRGGKGVIYVWASGNGGVNGDSCAYDGYASNIYTLSIGSTTENGHIPVYSERCPSTMAVTYSSGGWDEKKVISTDLNNTCTSGHSGTSASAPLAAGIIALVLEANPNLTWRDVKHLVAWTSDPFSLLRTPGWYVNGVGMLIHPVFGFGLMDAERLIKAAVIWTEVPQKSKCVVQKVGIKNAVFTNKNSLIIPVTTRACQGTNSEVRYLEHVEVIISLSHLRRGAVRIFLQSPSGTKTLIAPQRAADGSTRGFDEWPFLSVHNWGENPLGVWTITIESRSNSSLVVGSLQSLRLAFHGTQQEPRSTHVLREWRRRQTVAAVGPEK